jgi:hypothetical protein
LNLARHRPRLAVANFAQADALGGGSAIQINQRTI